MEDDRLISKQKIHFWFFHMRNKSTHILYIVKQQNKPCGYMEIKNIDYTKKVNLEFFYLEIHILEPELLKELLFVGKSL